MDIACSNIFSEISPQARETKGKGNKQDDIKLKRFCTAKETTNKMKKEPTEWKNILANDTSDKAAVPNLFGTRGQLHARQFFHDPGLRGRGVLETGVLSSGGKVNEASPACPLLTSCCGAWFLTDHGLVPVLGLGVGNPCDKVLISKIYKELITQYQKNQLKMGKGPE